MRKHVRSLFAGLALAALPALAQGSKTEVDKPSTTPGISQLSAFVGTWGCTGKAFASPMAPEHATAATVKGTMAVGNRWVHISYDESAQGNPMPVHAAMYMGWDAAQKKYVVGCVDSFGSYCTQTSSGWNGDSIVFEGIGNMDGKKVPVRDTFKKNGAVELTHTGEMQAQEGTWTKLDEETCRRKGKKTAAP